MRQAIALTLVCLMFTGCAGRQVANTIPQSQYGDRDMSCRGLEQELSNVQEMIQNKIPQTDKTLKNVLLGTAGWFFIVPFFFMDLSKVEQVELESYRARYNHLQIVAADKDCGSQRKTLPSFEKMTKEQIAEMNTQFESDAE